MDKGVGEFKDRDKQFTQYEYNIYTIKFKSSQDIASYQEVTSQSPFALNVKFEFCV